MFSSIMCALMICAQGGLSRPIPISDISKVRSRVEGCSIVEQNFSEAIQTTLQLARPENQQNNCSQYTRVDRDKHLAPIVTALIPTIT